MQFYLTEYNNKSKASSWSINYSYIDESLRMVTRQEYMCELPPMDWLYCFTNKSMCGCSADINRKLYAWYTKSTGNHKFYQNVNCIYWHISICILIYVTAASKHIEYAIVYDVCLFIKAKMFSICTFTYMLCYYTL